MADEITTNMRVSHLSALLPPSCVFDMLPGGMQIYSQVIETRDQVRLGPLDTPAKVCQTRIHAALAGDATLER